MYASSARASRRLALELRRSTVTVDGLGIPNPPLGRPHSPTTWRRRRLLVLTAAGKASWWMTRVSPSLYLWLMTRGLRRELAR